MSTVEDRYRLTEGRILLTGVQALVRLAMDQRRADAARGIDSAGFVTGYPGSPLAGVDLELERRRALLDELHVVHQPALNEELAATAIAGSQLVCVQPDRGVEGVFAVWYGKAPGLDRASDAMRHGNLIGAGAAGGALVCVGDDGDATSSSVPSASEPTLYGLGMPILCPADPQGILDLGLHGLAMSRASGVWVGVKIASAVANASQTVTVGPGRVQPMVPDLRIDGEPFAHRVSAQLLGARLIEMERSLFGARLEIARRYAVANHLNKVTARADGDVLGIVAAGSTSLAVVQALRLLGIDEDGLGAARVRLLDIAMPYPLDRRTIAEFASGLREILVVEDKRAFLEPMLKDALYGLDRAPLVVGKTDEHGCELVPSSGTVDADTVASVLARRLPVAPTPAPVHAPPIDPLPLVRTAYFCAGCPHSTGAKVPPGSSVGAGSGCHGLVISMGPRQVGNVVGRFQMGGEGAMWNGMSPFVARPHFIQNIGDGTFAHSGSLALRAAVASGVTITYKLLVNSAVAMTGGQPVPGDRSVGDLVRLLQAEGVRRIIVTTDDRRRTRRAGVPAGVEVWDRHRIVEAQQILAEIPGVTVLVHDQECAAERRRARTRSARATRAARATRTTRVVVNARACEGCGECGAVSNCLAVRPHRTDLGLKVRIHQDSCNLDYSCLDAECPALVTATTSRTRPAPSAPSAAAAAHLRDPEPRAGDGDHFAMRIAGVGGTGVVTVAQIVATAAHLEGRFVRGLDETGIAQKGGPVVSDLRIGRRPIEAPHKLAAGECDLYLGCDILVAADARRLAVARADRTIAVVSTAQVPTGRQVADPTLEPPPVAQLQARIASRSRSADNVWLDAAARSRALFGSEVCANVLLLGAAYQQGALPLPAHAIEAAIAQIGDGAEANLEAFRQGRLAVARSAGPPAPHAPPQRTAAPAGAPAGTDARIDMLIAATGAPPGGELERLLRTRVPDLVAYQDLGYASRYAELVGRVRSAEAARCHVSDGPFARAVATYGYTLMAYKDEYEVARLHLDPALRAAVDEEVGRGARITWHLRPPLLHALGVRRTLNVRRGARAAFWVLRSLRHLRGTPLDPCGYTRVRRVERALRDEYHELVLAAADTLEPATHERAVALATAPELVRGYGAVKLAAAERYRERIAQLCTQAGAAPARRTLQPQP